MSLVAFLTFATILQALVFACVFALPGFRDRLSNRLLIAFMLVLVLVLVLVLAMVMPASTACATPHKSSRRRIGSGSV